MWSYQIISYIVTYQATLITYFFVDHFCSSNIYISSYPVIKWSLRSSLRHKFPWLWTMTVFLPINEAALEGSNIDSSKVPKIGKMMKHGWTWLETSWLYILKATLRTMWKTGNSGHLWCECLIHFASAVLVTSAFNPSLYSIAILAIRTKMEITWQQTSFRKASDGLQWPAYPSSIGLHKWCFPCGSISCGSKQQIVQVSQGQLSEKSRKT